MRVLNCRCCSLHAWPTCCPVLLCRHPPTASSCSRQWWWAPTPCPRAVSKPCRQTRLPWRPWVARPAAGGTTAWKQDWQRGPGQRSTRSAGRAASPLVLVPAALPGLLLQTAQLPPPRAQQPAKRAWRVVVLVPLAMLLPARAVQTAAARQRQRLCLVWTHPQQQSRPRSGALTRLLQQRGPGGPGGAAMPAAVTAAMRRRPQSALSLWSHSHPAQMKHGPLSAGEFLCSAHSCALHNEHVC